MTTPAEDFARGKKEGQTDALLAEHSRHLATVNGSIERAAIANEAVAEGLRELASEIRTLQEDSRAAANAVTVAARTLAAETERRRAELADVAAHEADTAAKADRKFSKREKVAGLVVSLGLGVAGLIAKHAGKI